MSVDDHTSIDIATLWLAEGACDALAARCEAMRDALAGTIARVALFAPVNHAIFGDCEEGRGWRRLVHDTVAAPTGSLTAALEQHRTLLTDFADTFRRIGDAYLESDASSADRSRKMGR